MADETPESPSARRRARKAEERATRSGVEAPRASETEVEARCAGRERLRRGLVGRRSADADGR